MGNSPKKEDRIGKSSRPVSNPHIPAPDRRQRDTVRRMVHERCNVQLYDIEEFSQDGTKAPLVAQGIVLDVSYKGIGLIVDNQLRPGSEFILELLSTKYPHQFKVTVIWYQELPSTHKILKENPTLIWRMGFRFEARSHEEKAILMDIGNSL